MISVFITAFKEPNIGRAIQACLDQSLKQDFKIIVSAPDNETISIVNEFIKKDSRIRLFKDEGKGKSYALNLIFKRYYKDDPNHILVFTDGDIYLDKNALKELILQFKDPKVGCITGRPIAINRKDHIIGYYSHLLLDAGAHKIRTELNKKDKFLECTGYLFAFRNGLIKEIPLDVAEDSIIPFIIYKQGYKIRYAPEAKVYVKYPDNLKDFIKQRKRAGVGAHSKLTKYYKDFQRVKSFSNEVKRGTIWALSYPQNIKEFIWTLSLFPVRLYIWISYHIEATFKNRKYQDAWERIESTK